MTLRNGIRSFRTYLQYGVILSLSTVMNQRTQSCGMESPRDPFLAPFCSTCTCFLLGEFSKSTGGLIHCVYALKKPNGWMQQNFLKEKKYKKEAFLSGNRKRKSRLSCYVESRAKTTHLKALGVIMCKGLSFSTHRKKL